MKRTAILRWSLLASLGLLPLACSGDDDDDDSDGAAGKGGSAGTAGKGGSGGTAGEGGSGGSTAGQGATDPGGAGAGGTGSRLPPTCTAPTVDRMGLTRCREGYRYRAEPQTCAYRADEGPGSGGAGGSAGAGAGEGGSGALDCGECNGEHEFCRVVSGTPFTPACSRGCLSDDECGDNWLCVCDANRGGFCTPATCRGDADCEDGYHCAEVETYCSADVSDFACQTPDDECLTSADCDRSTCTLEVDVGETLKRTCEAAVCGRPFLVEAAVRVAPVTSRDDWTERGLAPRVDHLTAAERAAEAAHWTKLGQMEHASIAAFARFQLQLLALGAPSELVQACNQALIDETAHTRLCFALASAYAGRPIGPSALDVSHSLDVTSLADIVDLVLAEGCFGETSAALDAVEAAEAAADPAVRSAYARIADDEQRHAELAFQFVRWALEGGGDEVRERISAAIQAPPSDSAGTRAVAVPCLRALLGAHQLAIATPAICANCATA